MHLELVFWWSICSKSTQTVFPCQCLQNTSGAGGATVGPYVWLELFCEEAEPSATVVHKKNGFPFVLLFTATYPSAGQRGLLGDPRVVGIQEQTPGWLISPLARTLHSDNVHTRQP